MLAPSIILRAGKVADSDDEQEGVMIDYDKAGRLASLELVDASGVVHVPQIVGFALGAT